ncbi:MAG: hypothetical protein RMK29_11010 [Myxococcales bacterium]|nr:hypothetical protein [Myxococcota bacterium]MDW8282235.1 hypothetical protein [Myxococcales bacterium]
MHSSVHILASCFALMGLASLGGCQDVWPPDPYLGAIDASGFDPLFRGPQEGCLAPRRGFGGTTGIEPVTWFYLGALTPRQLDLANAADPTRTPPTGAYVLSGCTVHKGYERFDPRTDSFVRTVQYPIMSNASPEPTSVATYRPWHVVIPASVRAERSGKVGCNDIKSQRSLEDRAGWDRERKVYGRGDFDPKVLADHPYGYIIPGGLPDGLDIEVRPPTWDDVRAGRVTFKDWPMVHVGMPIMKTANARASCPLTPGGTARYPRFPADPAADFQFPSQSWLRGLLSGYLDGGDLPITTEPARCPALVPTGRSCTMPTDCNTARAEVCVMGRCLGRVPVCPKLNDLYVPQNEVASLATGTVELMDMSGKRTAEVLAIFAATPGQDGFSPVCRVRPYDPSKVTCTRKEAEAIAPRPLCTAAEIAASPGAVVAGPESYVHCLFLRPQGS